MSMLYNSEEKHDEVENLISIAHDLWKINTDNNNE